MPTTTIKLSTETKARIEKLKEHPKESFDEAIKKMLHILNTMRKSPERAERILKRIDASIRRRASREKEQSK